MPRPDLRRILLLTHRWLGVAGGLLFVLWFASGIVMVYKRMPALDPTTRLVTLAPLDLSTATVPPYEAARANGITPARLRAGMLTDRPVYRFAEGRRWSAVFADSGALVEGLSRDMALAVAARFAPGAVETMRYEVLLTAPDQWTLELRALLPMHRIALGDALSTLVYVSDRTGEVVLDSTAPGRRWAYLGPVAHWLYFRPFRALTGLWAQTVIWLSVLGCLLTASGLAWGLLRFSPRRLHRLARGPSRSPYVGLMKWHHYLGLIFGLFSFTWVLSGGLSMDPWNWHPGTSATSQQREAFTGGPIEWSRVGVEALASAVEGVADDFQPREVEVIQVGGVPHVVAYRAPELRDARTPGHPSPGDFLALVQPLDYRVVALDGEVFTPVERFDDDDLIERAEEALPGHRVTEATLLEEYDAYYYHRANGLPLPVWRVVFDDPAATWLYIDPGRALVVRKEERLTRLNRWLYRGLHSLDFPFLYARRGLWEGVVIAFSLGCLGLIGTTLLPSWRRLARRARPRCR